ncbi:hypothetical protein HAP48_0042470 [Bradyrhizobium septentrionale]|uniref:Uncharacterized protein n=1 Tax=Bradyrhizobium septentrionale TaxID=1404411 RepID=A0A974A1J7_9BRAD|nr:hypothetical protein [Bradyrhizobium septentrionale]UGY15124.1 hypothetical protein HAP48_0042470 [Bradyrhizobium septentrionale]
MTGFTDYSAKNALNYLTGAKAMPALTGVWLALFTAVGTDAGTGFTEVAGNGYARVQVAGSVATTAATTTASPTITHSAVPSWVTVGMQARDATTGNVVGTVQLVGATTVTLTANAAFAISSGDSITYSAFPDATGSAPVSASNGAQVTFAASTSTGWGTLIAWGLFDASSAGNLTFWDYMGQFSWLPATVTAASPGVITAKAHGYANGDSFIFSTEYGGTAPTFSAGSYTGLQTVAGVTADTFNVTGVNTSASGSGSVRKVASQSMPGGITAQFSASSMTLSLA